MAEHILSVGFGRADISPLEPVPLAGYGNTSRRISKVILDPLYATCLAFTDETGKTVLAYAMDLTSLRTVFLDRIRQAIADATGVPAEQIVASCSHNHSSPDVSNPEQDSIPRYIDRLETQMIAAAKEALTDRTPARLQIGSIETAGLNFVRRYVMEDGTFAGDNYGTFKKCPIACHETEADHTLQMVKILRSGKKDIQIANFQMHPHRAGGFSDPRVTSDIVGVFRQAMEYQHGCLFAYFTGGSGNVNGHSRVPEENITKDYTFHGLALAEYAAKVQFRDVKAGPVRFAAKTLQLPVNHSLDGKVADAQKVVDLWKTNEKSAFWKPFALEHGFNSPFHAQAAIIRSELGDHLDMPIWAFSIGDVGFAVAPYEMFDTNGKQIKDGSPFTMTLILTCSNAAFAYFPSELGFRHGGYSADICRFTPGVGERTAEEFLGLLKEIR